MKICKTVKNIRKKLGELSGSVGFVPTMGALHEGHMSLVRKARRENDIVVVSIFLNPLQFGEGEDLDRYPKTLEQDIEFLTKEGVDFLFLPKVDEIYGNGFNSKVVVNAYRGVLCDSFRPGHFDGVTTVVAKLFNIVLPDTAYFGQKDYQQFMLIDRMVNELNFQIKLKMMPIVREKNGLAMSSRNSYLSDKGMERASHIYKALMLAKKNVLKGLKKPYNLKNFIKKYLSSYTDKIEYIEILDAVTLERVSSLSPGKYLIAIAAYVEGTRLIDNILVKVKVT